MASRILSKAATIDSTRLEATIAYIRWGSVGLLLVGIACLFSSVGLIWAIKRKEITYVVPWIASHLIYTLYNIIITSVAAFKLYTWQVPYHHLYIACMLIWDGGMLILLYFIAVVKSYYYQVKRQKRREANAGGGLGGANGGCSTSSFRVRSNCSSSNAACSPCDNFSYQLPPEQFSPQINNNNGTDQNNPPGGVSNGVPSPLSDNNDSSTTPSAPVQRDLSEYRYFCPPSAPPAPPYSTVEPPPYSAVADSPVIASPPPPLANSNPVRLPSGTQTLPRLDGTHSNRNTSPISLIGSALLNNYSTCDRNANGRGVAPCRVNRGSSLSRNSPQDDHNNNNNNNFAGWGSNAGVRFPPRRQNSVPANEIFRSSGMGRYYENHRDRFFKYP